MTKDISIKMKLLLTVIGAILTVSFIIEAEAIYSMKKELNVTVNSLRTTAYKAKEEELKNYVSLAYETVNSYYERTSKDKIRGEVKNYIVEQSDYLFSILETEYKKNKGVIPDEELKQRLKSIVHSIRYGKAGYFWINDFDYKMIMHPIKENLNNKYFKNTPKVAFVELGVNALNTNKKDHAFIEYSFYSPKAKKTLFKSSIVKVFKPYNWIIGTGAYIDDVSEKMKAEALKAVQDMKYGKTGYFWINDSKHVVLAHGAKPALAGKNLYNLKDKKGTYLYQEIVKSANAKAEGGLVKYFWTIPGKEGTFEKFSYVRNFKEWDFIIGTGAYITDIEETIAKITADTEKSIQDAITMSLITIFVIVILISLLAGS